jgi:hypothetical protein
MALLAVLFRCGLLTDRPPLPLGQADARVSLLLDGRFLIAIGFAALLAFGVLFRRV